MEKITKKAFIEEMQRSHTYFGYNPPIPFYEKTDYQSFVNKDAEKIIQFLVEKVKYKEYLEKIAEISGETRTVTKVQSDGSLIFSNGSTLGMNNFGKKVFLKHKAKNGKSCLSCVSFWECGDVQKFQLLSYIIK